MGLSFIFKEDFKMENHEFNKEEFLKRMKNAADTPTPSSTIDIYNQMRTYRTIAVEARKSAKMMMEMKESVPEQMHDELEDKIELLMDWSNGAQKVFKAICELVPLAQRLDCACNMTKEQIRDIINEIEEMDE